MKILGNICAIVWVVYLFGKHLFPSLFGNFFVFWGINIFLALFLAIGFAISLSIYFHQDYKTIKSFSNSASFLFMFLMILILPISVHHTMNSLNTFSTAQNHLFSVKNTSDCETEEGRLFYAKFLFERYGIKIPYQLDSGDYITFKPTEDLITKYRRRLEQQEETIKIEQNLSRLAYSSMKLAIVLSVVFFLSFVITILYVQYQEKKMIKS